MSEEERSPENRKFSYVGLATWAVLLPLFYVLSVGPVVWICHNVQGSQVVVRLAEVFYFPLVFLLDNEIEPFHQILDWYIQLFR